MAWAAASLVGGLVVAAGVCEWLGWPFLAGPVERYISAQLDRQVSFSSESADGLQGSTLRIHLLGRVRVEAGTIRIAAPAWSSAAPTLVAANGELQLRYRDLWAARSGEPLRIASLRAARIDSAMERLTDGRASWQFGPAANTADTRRPAGNAIKFDLLEIREGQLTIDDAVLRLKAHVDFGLQDSSTVAGLPGIPSPASAPAASATTAASAGSDGASGALAANQPTREAAADNAISHGMHAQATGTYQGNPLKATLRSGSVLPWVSGDAAAPSVDLSLRLQSGPARMQFDGSVRDLLNFNGLRGKYMVAGSSLATAGQPLGLTLPTTAPFRIDGELTHDGSDWTTVVKRATVGRSELNGEFTFAPRETVPLLTGRLGGKALWLEDLAPAIGAAPGNAPTPVRADGKVLPDRRFDLPALRAMDADVRVDLARLELGQVFAEALTPLQGHLQLNDGVLSLTDLVARTAQGRISGNIQLDGRPTAALWKTDLRWSGLTLEQWIHQERAAGQPPYATGRLGGRLDLKGAGRSTAELLASAQGHALLHWTRGTVSHLAVEAAGIDVAQALGVLIRGDNVLPVNCGAADLAVERGTVTPKVMLVDTRDSTVWVDGSLSLASEKLDLRARVSPKDFSPLALRTPIEIQGTLGNPDISLAKGPLLARLVPAALLTLVNPLAGLLPLIDTGDPSTSEEALAGCRSLIAQAGKPAKPAGAKPTRP